MSGLGFSASQCFMDTSTISTSRTSGSGLLRIGEHFCFLFHSSHCDCYEKISWWSCDLYGHISLGTTRWTELVLKSVWGSGCGNVSLTSRPQMFSWFRLNGEVKQTLHFPEYLSLYLCCRINWCASSWSPRVISLIQSGADWEDLMADRDSFTGSSTSLDLPERHMTSFKAATVYELHCS